MSFAGTATAQNALGDGRALDRNLNRSSNSNDGGRSDSFRDQIRRRNAIVTGNAPGGLSFRGDVGYRAPDEFSGDLGSNDLFAFRRDSLSSGLAGLAGRGFRGTEALQLQRAYTVGGSAGVLYDPIDRAGTGATGAVAGRGPRLVSPFSDGGFTDLTRSMRSSSGLAAEQAVSPALADLSDPRTGRVGALLRSSSLRGLRVLTPDELRREDDARGDRFRAQPTTGGDRFSTAPDGGLDRGLNRGLDRGLDQAQDRSVQQDAGRPRDGGLQDGVGRDAALQPTVRSGEGTLDQLRDAARAPGEPGAAASERDEWLEDLRERLRLEEQGRRDQRESELEGPDRGDPGEAGETGEADEAGVPDDVYARLLGRAEIDSLMPNATAAQRFRYQMEQAQAALQAGRYFEAEAGFTRALQEERQDPGAMAGRVFAQLGAGTYLSAALNLESLFTTYPELVNARYSERLLPSGTRTAQLVDDLRAVLATAAERARAPEASDAQQRLARQQQRSSGLLLAFLGHQTQTRVLISQGLDAVRAGGGEDRLAALLERVWLGSEGDQPAQGAESGGGG